MRKVYATLLSLLLLSSLTGAERNEPLTIYLLVDKSLSMEESGAFSDVQNWLSVFVDENLIKGDTVFLYFFYGETQQVFAQTIANDSDFLEIKHIINTTKADGAFTNIGLALDTVKELIKVSPASKKTAFVLTDLIQEASFGSKYAGTYYDFAQKYMTEDKIIEHEGRDETSLWYEITLQIGELNAIEERAQKIYNTIKNTTTEPLYLAQNRSL